MQHNPALQRNSTNVTQTQECNTNLLCGQTTLCGASPPMQRDPHQCNTTPTDATQPSYVAQPHHCDANPPLQHNPAIVVQPQQMQRSPTMWHNPMLLCDAQVTGNAAMFQEPCSYNCVSSYRFLLIKAQRYRASMTGKA